MYTFKSLQKRNHVEEFYEFLSSFSVVSLANIDLLMA